MNNHIHKYRRIKMGNDYEVYKCVLPGCPHYIRPELVVGRFSLCWGCDEQFTMSATSATRLKPKCQKCIDKTVARRVLS